VEVRIEKAVLHILDTSVGMPVLSEKELDVHGETETFLEKHLTKVMEDDSVRTAYFYEGENQVREYCRRIAAGEDFLAVSTNLAAGLYQIMQSHAEIPPADLLCCLFEADEKKYYGVLKLNYKSNFIHYVQVEEDVNAVMLIRQRTVLPSESQRIEEAFVANLEDFSVRLIEKEYEIDGEKQFYLSKLFLQCHFDLSAREKARLIDKTAQKVAKKYCGDPVAPLARLKKAVTEAMDGEGSVNLERVAQAVFYDDPSARREYLEEIRSAGLEQPEVKLSEKIANRKFRHYKIQTDTGIEIEFPADYFNDRDKLEFVNNVDGTISIVIKNVGKIINK